jgi:serine/threonine protein phosphatase 1
MMNENFINSVSTPLIRTVPANNQGRDFVVGDLHGCRALLDRLLDFVRFDTKNDRLFSVGDLIDRGPDSMGCLVLLKEPWFYAVRGNHEEMLLDFFWKYLHHGCPVRQSKTHPLFLNGGAWINEEYNFGEDTPKGTLKELLRKVRQLPLLIVVGEGQQRFHVVHAELYDAGNPDEVLHDEDIDGLIQEWSGTDFSDVPPSEYPYFTHRWLWCRILNERMASDALTIPQKSAGLSDTYCGHNLTYDMRKRYSHICIDTGAFLAGRKDADHIKGGLSLVDVKDRTVYFTDGFSPLPDISSL